MLRRLLLSLLAGGAIVALDRPDEARERVERARHAARLCAAVPFACRAVAGEAAGRAAKGATDGATPTARTLPFLTSDDYVGEERNPKDRP